MYGVVLPEPYLDLQPSENNKLLDMTQETEKGLTQNLLLSDDVRDFPVCVNYQKVSSQIAMRE